MNRTLARHAVAAILVASGGLGTFLLGSAACTTRECIQTYPFFGGGEMVGPDTWESNPIDGTWVNYPPAATLLIEIPPLAGRDIIDTQVFVSPVARPNDPPVGDQPANNYAEASGNLAEFQQVVTVDHAPSFSPYADASVLGINVFNGTCAQYYVRVLVVAAPLVSGADAGPTDAEPADASDGGDDADDATDASDDANPDGGTST